MLNRFEFHTSLQKKITSIAYFRNIIIFGYVKINFDMSVVKIYFSAEEKDFLAADQRFSSNNLSNSNGNFFW